MKCKNCGESLKRLMLLAMLSDAGAKVSPGANECNSVGHDKHEFVDEGNQ